MNNQEKQPDLTAGIYARHSGNGPATASIEAQIAICRQKAESEGVLIDEDHIYTDESASGQDIKNRPGMLEMLKSIAEHDFPPILYVKDDKRLFRNEKEASHWSLWIWEQEVEIRLCRLDTESTWFSTRMMHQMADMERKRSALQAKPHIEQHFSWGFYCGGGVPFGYRTERQQVAIGTSMRSKWVFVLDPKTAPVAEEVFNQYLQGDSVDKIANYLKAHNMGSSTCKIRWILDRPLFYCGNYNQRGQLVQFPHPAIISQDIAQLVTQRRQKLKIAHKFRNPDQYPLTGLIYCSHCHSHYRGRTNFKRKQNKIYYYYRCSHKYHPHEEYLKKYDSCDSSPPIRADKLNQAIKDRLLPAINNPQLIRDYFHQAVDQYNQLNSHKISKNTEIDIEMAKIDLKIGNLIHMMADQSLPHEQVRNALKQEQNRKEELNSMRPKQPPSFRPTEIDFQNFQQNLLTMVQNGIHFAQLVSKVIKKITVLEKNKVKISLKLTKIDQNDDFLGYFSPPLETLEPSSSHRGTNLADF